MWHHHEATLDDKLDDAHKILLSKLKPQQNSNALQPNGSFYRKNLFCLKFPMYLFQTLIVILVGWLSLINSPGSQPSLFWRDWSTLICNLPPKSWTKHGNKSEVLNKPWWGLCWYIQIPRPLSPGWLP